MELRPRHLLVCAVAAGGLHAAAAALLWPEEHVGAIGAGVGGVSVSLLPAGGVVGGAAAVPPEEVAAEETLMEAAAPLDAVKQMLEPAPIESVSETVPEPVSAAPSDVLEAAVVTERVAVNPVVATSAVAAAPAPIIEAIAALEAVEPSSPPEQVPPSDPVAAANPRQAAPAAAVKPVKRPTRRRQTAKQPAIKHTPPEQTAAKQAVSAKQTAQKGPEALRAMGDAANAGVIDGARQGADGGGDPGAKRDYMSQIAALLMRQRRYPRRARSRGEEGVGELLFVLGANGHVLRAELTSSSGHLLLDKEILALLERAAPLPPIPPEVGVQQMTLRVPIAFNLR